MTAPVPRPGQRPDVRRLAFQAALAKHDGNLTRTAEALGISRRTASKWYAELRAGTLLARLS